MLLSWRSAGSAPQHWAAKVKTPCITRRLNHRAVCQSVSEGEQIRRRRSWPLPELRRRLAHLLRHADRARSTCSRGALAVLTVLHLKQSDQDATEQACVRTEMHARADLSRSSRIRTHYTPPQIDGDLVSVIPCRKRIHSRDARWIPGIVFRRILQTCRNRDKTAIFMNETEVHYFNLVVTKIDHVHALVRGFHKAGVPVNHPNSIGLLPNLPAPCDEERNDSPDKRSDCRGNAGQFAQFIEFHGDLSSENAQV